MEVIDPDSLRLMPGQSVHGVFQPGPDLPDEIGLFLKSVTTTDSETARVDISQRASVIRFGDVLLVLTMLKVRSSMEELFDVWWNYHSSAGESQFQKMAEQESITVHYYARDGKKIAIRTENGFKKFFTYAQKIFDKTTPWSDIEFDRAVRGFCAESYPRENLWELIETRQGTEDAGPPPAVGIEDYSGVIPNDLHDFYVYAEDQGHCIRVIPSTLEERAQAGNPVDFLHPAPVKTVLRGGYRWAGGYPVAPIPFIPGMGLAVPPDDVEK
jgi:hypothetical protein